ncbi:pyridoxal phosphate-dependent transferase [Mycena maculata]|uniref:Pyridoxal phosphate-dependent transferase n=1 Tax=Mycena maculata TaxID=230809 RepID=A0AAD7IIK1_9AGAR|nr:pyridoxal phosphate-dependent transferase [Mycena maculata]
MARSRTTYDASLQASLISVLGRCPQIRAGKSTVFVVVESLYSMDGDVAPLAEIIRVITELVPEQAAYIIVDKSHATGVYGAAGRGLVSSLSLKSIVHTRIHTFGKALGSSGAVVLTSPPVRAYLINYARSLIFTTSLPLFSVIAISCALDILEAHGDRLIARLMHLCHFFGAALGEHLAPVPREVMALLPPTTHLSDSHVCAARAGAPSPPRGLRGGNDAAPRGTECIRVCVHAGNTEEELLRFVRALVASAGGYVKGGGTAGKSHL